jgi:hypothetical protein
VQRLAAERYTRSFQAKCVAEQRRTIKATWVTLRLMPDELEVLKIVSERLEAAHIPFMLTGSFAMAYYGQPRMTRDLDLVVSLGEEDVHGIVAAFSPDFYIDADDTRAAILTQRQFNLMHNATGIKVDLIVLKSAEYRKVEFARRQLVVIGGVKTWIVSREDLILSKLVWTRDTKSELQRRDVKNLLDETMDREYLSHWADRLGVTDILQEIAE